MFEIAIIILLIIVAYNIKYGFINVYKKIEELENVLAEKEKKYLIKPLDLNDVTTVDDILSVQQKSYKVEADLIGFHIPRLDDDRESIQDSEEQFYGYYQDDTLIGIISFMKEDYVDIHRLAVDPDYFKKGIASELYNHINNILNDMKQVVATGKQNEPAINFYIKNGFEVKEEIEIEEGLYIVRLEK